MDAFDTKLMRYQRPKLIRTATSSDFGGGLDLVTEDVGLKSRFAKVLKNFYRGLDGSLRLRYGTKQFANFAAVATGTIVDHIYFADYLVVVTTTGQIVKISSAGTCTLIWSSAIAALLPGAPSGWGSVTEVSFVQFKGDLVVVNGTDKPIKISPTLVVTYLGDPANSNSNVNTPICKYVIAAKEYVVMAGQSGSETVVFISARQSAGTWSGDTPPNDATTIDVGASVTEGESRVIGLGRKGDNIFVFFDQGTVILTLGNYLDDGTHNVQILDTAEKYGIISNRLATTIGEDTLFTDLVGTGSFAKNQLGTFYVPDRQSDLIAPLLQEVLKKAKLSDMLTSCFAVWHKLLNQYIMFVKYEEDSVTVTRVFGLILNKRAEIKFWSEYTGWDFTCGCVSVLGRVFFGEGTKIYQLGDTTDEYYADYFETDPSDEEDGNPIAFDWELPWSVFSDFGNMKKFMFIRLFTKGLAQFTVDIFMDYLYKDKDDEYVPTNRMEFVAGDSAGFGDGDQPYGGGRRTADVRAWSLKESTKFYVAKFRIWGSTRKELSISSITFGYLLGGAKR